MRDLNGVRIFDTFTVDNSKQLTTVLSECEIHSSALESVEGWENSFNAHVGSHHANIWKLIGVLKNGDDVSGVNLVKILQGNPSMQIQCNPMQFNPVYAR